MARRPGVRPAPCVSPAITFRGKVFSGTALYCQLPSGCWLHLYGDAQGVVEPLVDVAGDMEGKVRAATVQQIDYTERALHAGVVWAAGWPAWFAAYEGGPTMLYSRRFLTTFELP